MEVDDDKTKGLNNTEIVEDVDAIDAVEDGNAMDTLEDGDNDRESEDVKRMKHSCVDNAGDKEDVNVTEDSEECSGDMNNVSEGDMKPSPDISNQLVAVDADDTNEDDDDDKESWDKMFDDDGEALNAIAMEEVMMFGLFC